MSNHIEVIGSGSPGSIINIKIELFITSRNGTLYYLIMTINIMINVIRLLLNGIIGAKHLHQDILGILQPLGHFHVRRLHGLSQRVVGPLFLLIAVRDHLLFC